MHTTYEPQFIIFAMTPLCFASPLRSRLLDFIFFEEETESCKSNCDSSLFFFLLLLSLILMRRMREFLLMKHVKCLVSAPKCSETRHLPSEKHFFPSSSSASHLLSVFEVLLSVDKRCETSRLSCAVLCYGIDNCQLIFTLRAFC
jgi:hypothetical protein